MLTASLGIVSAAAQLPSTSLPVFVADERTLVGRYRYEERADGMKVAVDLNADHTASYRITTGTDDADFLRAEGFWTLDGDVIHIHNKPRPVRLERAGPPTRDAAVGLSVVADNVDGSPADGLGVTWEDAQGLFALSEGRHTTGADQKIAASQAYVMRLSDRRVLQTLELRPDGPNSFRLTYHPSDVEPFDIPAIALDAKAQRIEVEVGTSFARLSRVSP